MTTKDELIKRDIKNEPILVINKRLNKYRSLEIPEAKRDKVNNLVKNSNLEEAIAQFKKVGNK